MLKELTPAITENEGIPAAFCNVNKAVEPATVFLYHKLSEKEVSPIVAPVAEHIGVPLSWK